MTIVELKNQIAEILRAYGVTYKYFYVQNTIWHQEFGTEPYIEVCIYNCQKEGNDHKIRANNPDSILAQLKVEFGIKNKQQLTV